LTPYHRIHYIHLKRNIINSDIHIPFFIVEKEALLMKTNLMRPCPRRDLCILDSVIKKEQLEVDTIMEQELQLTD
jgi:hypothetical protein